MDYPRRVSIVSIDASGTMQRHYEGDVIDRLVRALATDEQRVAVDFDLSPNTTIALRIEQTGRSRTWWSLHELNVWSR